MFINKSYKFRIYPSKKQEEFFKKSFDACRFIYNSVLAYKVDAYKHGINYGIYEAIKDLTKIKKIEGYEWLQETSVVFLQQSLLNLDNAFKKFFKEKKVGFPKFKNKKNNKNTVRFYPTYIKIIDFINKKIKIPKVGWIEFKDKRIFNSKIKSITISKNKCNQYFASILVEEEFEQNLPKQIQESKVFAADMSCKDFLVSQEMKFENQKFYRKNERHRKYSKKVKGSNNQEKERLKLAKTYLNITNQRKGYQWNLAHKLVQKFDALIFEDLNIEGMKQFNKGVSKTVTLDFSFSEFLSNLEWECFKENKHFVKIDRFFPSSKLCFNCGEIKQNLSLSDRIYKCDCGYMEDRDLNAAKNIKREGIEILQKQGINLIKNSTVTGTESYAFRNMRIDLINSAKENFNFLEIHRALY